MRAVIWFVLLFAVAVVAATTFGANDGLVSLYWNGWRMDVSMNLFLVALLGVCFALVMIFRAVNGLLSLPRRAHEWRVARRDRTAQASLREALAQYLGGRYTRAQKSAQRALLIQSETPELAQDNEFTVLGHLLAAGSAHRLQNRVHRDDQLERAFELSSRSLQARSAEEGARLLAAEWALDDRDAPRALELLSALPPGVARRTHALRLKLQARSPEEAARLLAAEWALDDRDAPRALELLSALPPGVARRTHALRLKLQASRLANQPQEALKTARLLAKHQAFSKEAAQGLLRSLAFESLDSARDADQVRRMWFGLDSADRRDPFVAARAAACLTRQGASAEARAWLRPFWDRFGDLNADERAALSHGLVASMAGLSPDWLARLESAAQAHPREPAVAYAVGCALAERELWGKSRVLLEQASVAPELPAEARRHAWLLLARMAEEQSNTERAAICYEAAAKL